jgi:hypothetical protein
VPEAGTPQPDADPAEPQPVFANVDAFMSGYLRHVVERGSTGGGSPFHWCPRWWSHPEAVSRIYVLWRTWECLRLDAQVGMSLWWRDHLGPHLDALTSPGGPFARCRPDRHRDPEPLPAVPAPRDVLAQLPEGAP